MRLFVGDDRAEDHHDVQVMDGSGRRLAKARLPEGVAGMARPHAIVGEPAEDQDRGAGGIETDGQGWMWRGTIVGVAVPTIALSDTPAASPAMPRRPGPSGSSARPARAAAGQPCRPWPITPKSNNNKNTRVVALKI
ncbi:hypothetical protein [Streptosporangium vulgare]|uniref:Transposase IS111A/IS1328/IS1533 N-terminal domain-containing protein n=1 Tax=Streptosporangium vulgare TaxID=46190 RepID=A0ABV5T4X6_9ACTN